MASPEMAVSALKNMLAAKQVDMAAGFETLSRQVESDPFSVRLHWGYSNQKTTTHYRPTFGGIMLGNSYVPTVGDSYSTTTTQTPMEEVTAIPLAEVDGFSVDHYPRLDFPSLDGKISYAVDYWVLLIHFANRPGIESAFPPNRKPRQPEVLLVTGGESGGGKARGEAMARQLADVFATLVLSAGGKVDGKRSFGVRCEVMTEAQRAAAGPLAAGGGLLVREAARGGQADRNGLRFLDMITAINGRPTPDHETAIQAFLLDPVRPKVTFLRLGGQEGDEARPVLERTVVFEP